MLKYGKNEEIRKIHGTVDLGDVMISSEKSGAEVHLGMSKHTEIHRSVGQLWLHPDALLRVHINLQSTSST